MRGLRFAPRQRFSPPDIILLMDLWIVIVRLPSGGCRLKEEGLSGSNSHHSSVPSTENKVSKCLLNVNYLWKVCWGLWRIRRKKMNKLCLTPCSLLSYASFNPRKWCLLLFLKREKWGSAVLQNCLRTQSYLVVGMEFKSRTI